jgi:hypothetical protein
VSASKSYASVATKNSSDKKQENSDDDFYEGTEIQRTY